MTRRVYPRPSIARQWAVNRVRHARTADALGDAIAAAEVLGCVTADVEEAAETARHATPKTSAAERTLPLPFGGAS